MEGEENDQQEVEEPVEVNQEVPSNETEQPIEQTPEAPHNLDDALESVEAQIYFQKI